MTLYTRGVKTYIFKVIWAPCKDHPWTAFFIWALFYAIGPPLSSGTKGSARSTPPDGPLVIYCVGESFLESLFSRVQITFAAGWEPFSEPIHLHCLTPLFHQDIYILTLYLLFQDYLCLTLFFVVLSDPEHFYDELFSFCIYCIGGIVLKIKLVPP